MPYSPERLISPNRNLPDTYITALRTEAGKKFRTIEKDRKFCGAFRCYPCDP
jgi:hypothetical protein